MSTTMGFAGKVAAGMGLVVAADQSLAFMCGMTSTPATSIANAAVSQLAQVQQPEASASSYSATAAVGAMAAVSVCAAVSAGRRSRASKAAGANRVVAMEAGGELKKCPKTGGPICFCNKNMAAPAIGATAAKQKASSCKKSGTACHAKFFGTDVDIDVPSDVKFPVKAKCEVWEAGKACDGSTTATGVTGTIIFTQTDAEMVTIDYDVKGLTPGLHGFHVHLKADFSNGCASAGPHYNPFNKWHGGREDPERHVGGLGNILAGDDGVAKGTMTDNLVKIFGEYTCVGRSMMIHAGEDDLGNGPLEYEDKKWPEGWPEGVEKYTWPPAPTQHTKTTGNAGARVACGVIVQC